MAILPIVIAPDPIFSKKATAISEVNDVVRQNIEDMKETMLKHEAVGLGANMVGLLERIIVVNEGDVPENNLVAMINPEIIDKSEETQTITEASLSFPFISAPITRSKKITVSYLDENAVQQQKQFSDFLSTVVQHEIDYLDGIVFVDHLSKLKREMLLKKMQKMVRIKN